MKINILLLLTFLLLSCSARIDDLFPQLINSAEPENGISYDAINSKSLYGNSGNKFYEKIYNQGKRNNQYLLDNAIFEKNTDFFMPNIVAPLTDGDIAIMLLMDINFKGTDKEWVDKFVPQEIQNDYQANGSRIWWNWIHNNKLNRQLSRVIIFPTLGNLNSHPLPEALL